MDLKQSLEFLLEQGQKQRNVTLLHEDSFGKTILVDGELKDYPKLFEVTHQLTSVESLVAFLNDDRFCKGVPADDPGGVVFVSDGFVTAHPKYEDLRRYSALLKLTPSEEFLALLAMESLHGQKEFWRKLVTDLAGCFPENLLAGIGSIRVKASSEDKVSISTLGLTDHASASRIEVEYIDEKLGPRQTELPDSWVWMGRIWDEFSETTEIQCQLELSCDDGLQFMFHLRRQVEAMRQHRLRLVETLRTALKPRYRVYDGLFYAEGTPNAPQVQPLQAMRRR